jgi:hypothetical protein
MGYRNQTEKGCRMAIPLQHEPEIEYPESDGKPMAESPIHLEVMLHCIEALKDHFAEQPDVYVSGNMLIYYEKGSGRPLLPMSSSSGACRRRRTGTSTCSGVSARPPASSWR